MRSDVLVKISGQAASYQPIHFGRKKEDCWQGRQHRRQGVGKGERRKEGRSEADGLFKQKERRSRKNKAGTGSSIA